MDCLMSGFEEGALLQFREASTTIDLHGDERGAIYGTEENRIQADGL